jgi:hypothetical protein
LRRTLWVVVLSHKTPVIRNRCAVAFLAFKNLSFSSSIAAHPERVNARGTAIEASATRAQARIETLGI